MTMLTMLTMLTMTGDVDVMSLPEPWRRLIWALLPEAANKSIESKKTSSHGLKFDAPIGLSRNARNTRNSNGVSVQKSRFYSPRLSASCKFFPENQCTTSNTNVRKEVLIKVLHVP